MAHKEYKVKLGDCISSIADKHGLFPDDVWNDAKNNKLKEERKDPNILMPGDVVHVREKEEKEESCASEVLHRFLRKGVPSMFNLRLLAGDAPRADEDYVLDIDGALFSGKTDADGWIKHPMPAGAKRGKLTFDEEEEYDLDLGALDPVTDEQGLAQRLGNLGYMGGEAGDDLEAALKQFQRGHGFEETGKVTDETRDAIVAAHGS